MRERKKKKEDGEKPAAADSGNVDDDQWSSTGPSPVTDSPAINEMVLPCALVFVVAVLCFANSLEGAMVMDDDGCITGNKDVTDPSATISDMFQHDYWGASIWDRGSHKSYRPLTILSFRMNYQMVGNYDLELMRQL
jgi:hypothetical protein